MKTKILSFFAVTAALLGGAMLFGAPSLDDAMRNATADYRERVTRAGLETLLRTPEPGQVVEP